MNTGLLCEIVWSMFCWLSDQTGIGGIFILGRDNCHVQKFELLIYIVDFDDNKRIH